MSRYKITVVYPRKNPYYGYHEDFYYTAMESFDNDCDAVMFAIKEGKEYRKTTGNFSISVEVKKIYDISYDYLETILDIVI